LREYDVHFFLVHFRITAENVARIRDYAETFENISFCEIVIDDVEPYLELARHGCEHLFPAEAYFCLCCYKHLPPEVDRILYIDAGDIIIHGDISEYYFDDFEGKSFIITAGNFVISPPGETRRLYVHEDFSDPHHMLRIRTDYINSGCFVINREKLRSGEESLIDDYLYLANELLGMEPIQGFDAAYLGDQGLLGIAFFGDMKFYGHETGFKQSAVYQPDKVAPHKYAKNIYRPYNFPPWVAEIAEYTPRVLHFIGPAPKPWRYIYSDNDADNPDYAGTPFHLSQGAINTYQVWWQYCEMTPIYEMATVTAEASVSALKKHYFPLFKQFKTLEQQVHKIISNAQGQKNGQQHNTPMNSYRKKGKHKKK